MPKAAILNALRLITAFAVMLSAVPFLHGASAPHEFGLSYVVQADVDFGHGGQGGHTHLHSHDDDEDGATLPSHGHEYTDHSHVTLGLPAPPPASLTGPQGKLARLREHCPPSANPPFRLDRPPCVLSVA